jgi:hypothetical protein
MKRYILVPIIATVILSSCNKSEDIDLGASQDASKAEFFYNDVNNISDEAGNNGEISRSMEGIMSGCATLTIDTISNPHTITIDFGSSNCLCADNRYRRGVINISFTGRYRDAGTTITITTSNYFVNDNQVIGTHTIVNQGTNTAGNIYYSVDVTGQVILASGAGTISWTSSRVREWIAGSSTPEFDDDVYSITGGGSGTSAGGNHIAVTITNPLIRKLDPACRKHFVQGTVEVLPDGKPVRILDFGTGDCDNTATVTINGISHTITLN